jgi:predicted cupin superfamily sugar epimerase
LGGATAAAMAAEGAAAGGDGDIVAATLDRATRGVNRLLGFFGPLRGPRGAPLWSAPPQSAPKFGIRCLVDRVQQLIDTLGLSPHPERGHYAVTYRSKLTLDGLPHGAPRPASTAIYFLLAAAQGATYLHRLKSDELFHLYEGGPLDVLILPPGSGGRIERLGLDLAAGQRPQLVIPAGTWFAAELPAGVGHCLWGCTVAPGFDFADFELGAGPELAAQYPAFAARIGRMLRPPG